MTKRFEIGANDFLLDGQPFLIRCGEMHFARVPREYWQHRLAMCAAMGLNTVCAYMFWNAHEQQRGVFDFSGNNDVAEFCRLAQQAGLKVILRPGPYACAEWDFGGFPYWLLKNKNIKVRTQDADYLAACKRYLLEVGKQLAPLQYTQNGPIVMVQVENEYGSYGTDREYIGMVRDMLVEAGFDVPLFTCDGPVQLKNDVREDIFSVVNFGSNPEAGFKALREIRKTGPMMCGEFYPGWFDSWGKKHHIGNTENVIRDLEWMMKNNGSFSIYMVHGGTSFAFSAGANAPPFSPQTTSYDYDAPINEHGDATPKFHELRKLFEQYKNQGESFPTIPAGIPVISFAEIKLHQSVSMLENLPKPLVNATPIVFEDMDQLHGLVMYRTMLPAGDEAVLKITEVHDYAQVRLDGEVIATLDRRKGQHSAPLPKRATAQRLDILVYAFGRVNYGPSIHDRKGISQKLELVSSDVATELTGFEHYQFPLDAKHLSELKFANTKTKGPAFYRGEFVIDRVGDTFLDLRQWNFGVVWVNGHNIGRYWNIGPTQSMYLPGCWLKQGKNEVIVWDLLGNDAPAIAGLNLPILDDLKVSDAARLNRRADQTIDLSTTAPVHTGTFAPGGVLQTISIPKTKARYFCIESLNSHAGDDYAGMGELYLLDEHGKDIARSAWKIAYADSEEFGAEDGNAANVLDIQAFTFWHTAYTGPTLPGHPHQIVIDLGKEQTITGFKYLPRPSTGANPPARIKDYRVYVSGSGFKGV